MRPMRNKGLQKIGEQYFCTPLPIIRLTKMAVTGTIIGSASDVWRFSHEGFAELQLYRMIFDSPAIDLDSLGLNTGDPAFRQIHSYSVGRPLAYLIDASIGKGGLIICALNFDKSFIEARYLLSRICSYAAGGNFKHDINLTDGMLNKIINGANLL